MSDQPNGISREEIANRFKQVIVDQLGCKADIVDEKSHIHDDLGADSLDAVEIVMATEEEFNLAIEEEDAAKLHTVANVIDYLYKRLNDKQ